MRIGWTGRWSGCLCRRDSGWRLLGARVLVDCTLPPDVIEVRGAPGSVVRFRVAS